MADVRVLAAENVGRTAAGELLRAEVARLVGGDPRGVVLAHSCPRCGAADHGRPLVVRPALQHPLHVSVGRAHGLTVVAVSDAGPVGVDVEPAAAAAFDGFDEVALHPDERADSAQERTRLWVRKEAVLKATGEGLRTDPRALRVDIDQVALADGTTVHLRDIAAERYAIAVAVLSERAPAISVRAAPAAGDGATSS